MSHPLMQSKGFKPRKGAVLVCATCGGEFYLPPSRVSGGPQYCSNKCQWASLKTNKPLNCLHCGNKFYVSRSQEKARNRGCCSKKCRERHYAKRGEQSHFWRGGVSSEDRRIRYSARMKEWRLAVFERDGYKCQNCGAQGGDGTDVKLHAHHVKEFAHYPELRFEVDNGLTLCRTCHYGTHHAHKRGDA
jgi:5-methylcytosine-specific restriction endonuclease McrA